jgi:ubiquinone biosynthesis protein UbiJ
MNFDPSIQVALCGALEIAINKALQFDPGSRYALARLQGKVLAVELTQPGFTVYVVPDTEGIRLQSVFDGEVTTRLRGSPMALLSLLNSQRVNLANSGVEVFGNTGFLIELQGILQNLDIDWEEAVSTVIGDVAGHQMGASVRGLNQWLGQRKQSFERMFGEFLTEEIRATPNRHELEYFYQQVDELRLGVDRVTARIQQFVADRANNNSSNSIGNNANNNKDGT